MIFDTHLLNFASQVIEVLCPEYQTYGLSRCLLTWKFLDYVTATIQGSPRIPNGFA